MLHTHNSIGEIIVLYNLHVALKYSEEISGG
jgi:hypothetical protein